MPIFLSGSLGPDGDGVRTVRIPAGRYYMSTTLGVAPDGSEDLGIDRISMPLLDVNGDRTVAADAREAKPVDVAMPGVPQTFGSYRRRRMG